MRIAYFGFDFFVDTLESLLQAGHTLVQVNTFETDNIFINRNNRLLTIAKAHNVPIVWGQPNQSHMERLRESDCDLVLAMGYPYKIPTIQNLRIVNLHPTLLPEGKGPFPLPWLILHHPEYAGLTLHKITSEWDSGPILAQTPVTVADDECLDSLCAKMQLVAKNFVPEVLNNFDYLWNTATPQAHGGSYWRATEREWTLNWEDDWHTVIKTVRAFGALESVAIINGEMWSISDAVGWPEKHSYKLGTVVHSMSNDLIIAAKGGLVLLRSPKRMQDKECPR